MMAKKPNIILQRKMYYDAYEKERGDGFYPQLSKVTGYSETIISFKLVDYLYSTCLLQIDNSVIYGFDGIYGIELLMSLNAESNMKATKILNIGGRIILPPTANSTYRVLSKKNNTTTVHYHQV